MKNILIGIIFLILSLQASGLQPQDTLYQKNGSMAVGKLLKKSKAEYRFQTSDKVIWTFSPDEVEKFVPATVPLTDNTHPMIMRKVILDTLSIDELKLYEDKAISIRNAGRILTLGGFSLWVITSIWAGLIGNQDSYIYPDDSNWDYIQSTLKGLGIISTLGGAPLWVVGGGRMDKAELLTLDFDELNLYKDKAVKMRHTGMTLTSCGVGIVAASYIVGNLIGEVPSDDPDATGGEYDIAVGVIGIGGTIGIATAIVGVPIWLTGGSRNAKAEITLQKFNIAPENSMAVGLGITIRF